MPDLKAAPGRDPRLDVLRGIALVMIYVNHVPGTVFEHLTSRNFGFSDAAEGFVLMAGVSAGLAYSGGFRPRATWAGARRIWRRVWTLYQVNLLITVWALGISAALALGWRNTDLLHANLVWTLFEKPLGFLVGVPLLTHQLGYANILPLYAVLLGVTPLVLMAGLRSPKVLLAGAILLWALAGQFRLNLPNYPLPGGWFFNPVSWQVIFVAGLLTGVAMKQGRRFVPVRRWLQWLCAAFLLLALVVMRGPAVVAETFNHSLWLLRQMGLPYWLTAFDKTFLTAPRLLHILALAYLVSTLPVVRRLAGAAAARPLALLGRQSLPVFALGSVLCFFAQAVRAEAGDHMAIDGALVFGGLGLQYGLAFLTERWKRRA